MLNHVTDTHALIWYLEDNPRLGVAAKQAFDACDRGEIVIYIPTISLVEILYLQEKGRISADLKAQLDAELQTGTSGLVLVDLTAEVADVMVQVPRTQVPDMPDRIIAATAVHLGVPLISRDRTIQLSDVDTIW
ncbi:type II toxin-antitoxin system VapC family toxin [Cyanobacteria bacterium FACHB-472]|nr:type II toxin-antitoxin system VapC family toxin [Cyanobacteria bacterium FACHB-472]